MKQQIFARFPRPTSARFSASLPAVWFEQATSERAVVRYSRGQPVRQFIRISGRRAEALDCTVYAVAARALVNIVPEMRRTELAQAESVKVVAKTVLQSNWMARK